jgi:hypothetical protein
LKALATTVINRLRVGQTWTAIGQSTSSGSRRHWINLSLLMAGSMLVSVPLFYRALFGMIVADYEVHVRLVQRGVEEGIWPAHFLFQALVYGLSGFSHDFASLAWAALVLLTTCVIAKVWLSYALLIRHGPRRPTAAFEDTYGLSHTTLSVIVTVALLLSAPIVRPWSTDPIYLGQISPNIWHNPTSILCWPLVILLFFAADAFLRSGRLRELIAVGSLAGLSVLAKPNYFLAFAPVYSLLALWRFGVSRVWLFSQLALVPTVILLCWQLTASFDGTDAVRPGMHIAWMPLSGWRVHSSSIPMSLLLSLAFPLSYLLVFFRSIQNRDMLLFAWGVMLSALIWTGCFAEVYDHDGAVNGDFNFSWGSHLSLFVLFLVTAMDMIDNPAPMNAIRRNPLRKGIGWLPWCVLGAHAASGMLWIFRQVIGEGY